MCLVPPREGNLGVKPALPSTPGRQAVRRRDDEIEGV